MEAWNLRDNPSSSITSDDAQQPKPSRMQILEQQVKLLTEQLDRNRGLELQFQNLLTQFQHQNNEQEQTQRYIYHNSNVPPTISEPTILSHLYFSGQTHELNPFLYLIDDHMPSIEHLFRSEQRKINWVARHFRTQDAKSTSICSSYNWWMSVLKENASIQHLSTTTHLASHPYILPHLLSLNTFLDKLKEIFGDKFEEQNAKKALDACKQGNRTIGEYNSLFSSLVYAVDLTEQSRCDKYRNGLNIKILEVALRREDWSRARTLAEMQRIAGLSAQVADELMALRHSQFNKLSSSSRPIHHSTPIPVFQPKGPTPMDLDSISTQHPLQFFRKLCQMKGLCFTCLDIFDEKHKPAPNRFCPNPPASFAAKAAFMRANNNQQRLPPQQLAAIDFIETPEKSAEEPIQGEELLANLALQEVWEQLGHNNDEESPLTISSMTFKYNDPTRLTLNFSINNDGHICHGTALLDTGASGSFINQSFVDKHSLACSLRSSPLTVQGYNGQQSDLIQHIWLGSFTLKAIDNTPYTSALRANVTKLAKVDVILGMPWIQAANAWIGGRNLALPPLEKLPLFLHRFKSVFSAFSNSCFPPLRHGFDCSIKLKPNSVPPFGRIYQLSSPEHSQLQCYIKDLLSKGFIRVSSSPAAAPIFFVKSKGKADRPCVDYRELNSMTIRDSYPIPHFALLLDNLKGCKLLSKIDLKAAFNLLRVHPDSVPLTAFRTPWGLFEYLVMPFGLANAPATFQRFIQHVLREYLDVFCFVYLDDILIFSKTRYDHEQHLAKVLQKLKDNNLQASFEKCEFFQDTVIFLGFEISTKGISMDPSKLDTITTWPYPVDLKTLCHGLLSNVDASSFAFSAILSQPNDQNLLQPVCFFSRKLTPAETSWQVHDLELGAVVEAFQQWHSWLVGTSTPVTVFSDHHNLKYFMQQQTLSPRQAWWASLLSNFNFRIAHTPGHHNPADPASRRIDYVNTCTAGDIPLLSLTGTDSLKVLDLSPIHSLDNHASITPPDEFFVCPTQQHLLQLRRLCANYDPPSRSITKDDTGLLWYHGCLFVPPQGRQLIFETFHNEPNGGHQGLGRTLASILRSFAWPHLQDELRQFVTHCDSCQRVKAPRNVPLGLLQPQPPPTRPWSTIGMDFIVKLPISNGFDSILVLTDMFTKGCHLIPCQEKITSAHLSSLFLDRFVRYHGFPDCLVTDRGSVFVSAFWRAFCSRVGLKHTPSTAYHPQTNGQTERLNQTLEDYLRHFCSYRQSNWAALLPMAELCFNNTCAVSTGFSPFFLWQGFHPRVNSITAPARVPDVDAWLELLITSQSKAMAHLSRAHQVQAHYYNRHRLPSPVYQQGDLVLLRRRHITTLRTSEKLDYRYLGPFMVDAMVGTNAVRLRLPPHLARLHPVFNISLIKSYKIPSNDPHHNLPPVPPIFVGSFPELVDWREVADILHYKRFSHLGPHYLLRWRNGSPADDTWVHLRNISASLNDQLRRFHEANPSIPRPSPLLFLERPSCGPLAALPSFSHRT
ncbi:hypothetical protein O181_004807 [Austropuccinia psidii MF-1]|uniref:RNA-directed DNA polymerase n=1 Tax=Austropuccinia psidii MF-1 TaxID=1389203 RepID=A0A9Q3BHL0_9BASI|nr:hypothetical protein [Austropuccinia psidii MF-1]